MELRLAVEVSSSRNENKNKVIQEWCYRNINNNILYEKENNNMILLDNKKILKK
jgi:hypothetical protein